MTYRPLLLSGIAAPDGLHQVLGMTDADRGKLEWLCCLSVVRLAGCFVRRSQKIGVESDAKLEGHVRRWLKARPNPESVERVVNQLHVYDEFSGLTEDEYAAVTLD